ncbi:hypothetical protein LguiA_017367 [Lonicera macranthoides]
MKGNTIELPTSSTKYILPILTLVIITTLSLYSRNTSLSLLHSLELNINALIPANATAAPLGSSLKHECNIFNGNWVPYDKGPYYTNETKCVIDDRQNCIKYGRPDTEFMKWRWKPDECELPLFDGVKFLELVKGKTMAFVGDSVGRNQMQSLVCLLASAADPIDVSNGPDERFRRWLYADYNFTVIALWSPLLIKTRDPNPNNFTRNSRMNLYLDEVDETWAAHVEDVDIVILSAGQWFFRPFTYFENGTVIGCNLCNEENLTTLFSYYGYRMAFRTAFRTLLSLKNFTGVTFLRTFSPSHFENGDWNNGGSCGRTRPFTKQEMKLDWFSLQLYLAQVEEFRSAESEGANRGLKFKLLDTTEATNLRADGHPNHYGYWPYENKSIADCVHWCLPGPIDTWNEFLLQMLKGEEEVSTLDGKIEENI